MGLKILTLWISLVVPWLRIHTSNVGGMGSIPGQESFVVQPKKKKKRKFQLSNHRVGSVGSQPPPILKDSSKVTVGLGLKRTDIYSLAVWRPEV